ncbi:MAG: CDP-alcohol phosphatidyltransferase family protein [Oscillospiraceae bacterium]|nr:CDP-alcohol phosphatidyltransferase family protein [Oscillospiraceae bacterium]
MIGFYDYTVILTYLSLLSSTTGIVVALSDRAHPYIGCFFLLLSGLCDAFDGKVARTKKVRSPAEKAFGIQIDSLSDLVAFGVLPTCIGTALIRTSPMLTAALADPASPHQLHIVRFLLHAVLVLYVLAAMIRLAYYNVTEEERQKTDPGARSHYLGLPVTSAALIFPLVLLLQYVTAADITVVYICAALLTGVLFLVPFRLKKPGLRGILIMVGIGAVEFMLMLIWRMSVR